MDFFNDLQDYFATLSSQEMLFFWLVAGLLFIIGLLIGLLIQSSRLKRYRAQYMITDKERADFQARALSAEGKLGALEKEVATLSREKVAVIEELEALKSRPVVTHDPSELEGLRDQIQLLQSENQRLAEELVDYRSSKATNESPGSSPASEPADVQDYLQAAEARFEAFEQRLQELSSENDRLNTEVSLLQSGNQQGQDRSLDVPYGTPHQPIIGAPSSDKTDADGEPLVIRADVTDPGARTDSDGGMEVIVDTRPSVVVPVLPPEDVQPDDLKRINNIGPFLEKKLNENGVYTFDQIADWTNADIDTLTDAIGYVPGIIIKDDWVGQARYLRDNRSAESETATTPPVEAPATIPVAKPAKEQLIKTDNLKVVEGIGPKIESILKDAGIATLEELAGKNPDQLRETLAAAGNRFKSHNPDSWPEQAKLAAAGELEALKALQDSM